jgi:hypothetical protein
MKNAWKFLLGCGCLSVIVGCAMMGAAVYLGGKAAMFDFQKRLDLVHYQNSREGRTGNLDENYVGFSFDYPKSWTIKTDDPDNINFVTVERRVDGKTWENLNVGYFHPAPTEEANQDLFRQVLGQIEAQFSKQFRDFHKVSEGSTQVNGLNGHEALYAGNLDVDGKRVDIFTRTIFLRSPDGAKGVSLMMMGTSLCPELTEPADLAKKGELPLVLESFKFE